MFLKTIAVAALFVLAGGCSAARATDLSDTGCPIYSAMTWSGLKFGISWQFRSANPIVFLPDGIYYIGHAGDTGPKPLTPDEAAVYALQLEDLRAASAANRRVKRTWDSNSGRIVEIRVLWDTPC